MLELRFSETGSLNHVWLWNNGSVVCHLYADISSIENGGYNEIMVSLTKDNILLGTLVVDAIRRDD